jgi:hypothetical protein
LNTQTSKNKEISRLLRRIKEKIDKDQAYNALYYVGELNLEIQRVIGVIRNGGLRAEEDQT